MRTILRAGAVLAALALMPARAAATLGPPEGKIDPLPEVEEATPGASAEAPPVTQQALPPPTVIRHPDDPVRDDAPAPAPAAPAAPPSTVAAKPDQKDKYERIITYILSGHRENYFITGVSAGDRKVVKFQYSVKFDLWPNSSRHSVYFAFTQKSLWALWDFDSSSPFLESNYAPEFFYGYSSRRGDIVPSANQLTWFLDYARAGFEHESNGMDGTRSHGWNRIQGVARGGVYLGTNHYFTLALKAWPLSFSKSENEDITEFVGYGIATLEYGYDPAVKHWYGGGNVTVSFQQGNQFDSRNALQVTAQWRPGYASGWWKFTPYAYAQYWSGYGETLDTYNIDTRALRVGISFEDRVISFKEKPPSSKPAN
jgi:outer membrane phospholipase A